MNRLPDDECMSRLRLDDAPMPYRRRELQRQTENDEYFSGSD